MELAVKSQSFLVGTGPTIADVAVLDALAKVLPALGDKAWAAKFASVSKYVTALSGLP